MRLFLKKTVICIAILLLSFGCLEVIVRAMNNDSYYSIKNKYILEHGSEIKTLILGSSHMVNAINPIYLNQLAFNLAIPSQGLKIDYELLSGYIDNLSGLENVVIDISYFSLRSLGFTSNDKNSRYINYNLYMCPKFECEYKYHFAISDFTYISKRFLIYGANMFVREPCDSLGWIALPSTSKSQTWDSEASSKARVKEHTIDSDAMVEQNVQYLIKIIELCKKKSLRLIAITTPVWHMYSDNFNEDQYAETQQVMRRLENEYNIEYYNFLKDDRFDSSDFSNIDHLSVDGATKFSNIISKELSL